MLVTNYFQTCCYITPVQDQTKLFSQSFEKYPWNQVFEYLQDLKMPV